MYNFIYYFLQLNMRLKYNDFLDIDINTGKFYYTKIPKGLTKPKKEIGQEAGCVSSTTNYIHIFKNTAHKLFVEFIVGNINFDIDHINGTRSDNSPENLRITTTSENLLSAALDNKCYTKNRDGNKFRVKINLESGKQYCSKSMSEQECIDYVKQLKDSIRLKLNGILTLRQIMDHMIDYNLL